MSLQIKRITKDLIIELKELFDKTSFLSNYSPFNKGKDCEFEWQFFSNQEAESLYYIAYDNKQLVGTLAALFIPMITPDRSVCLTIKPEDALINIKSLIDYKNRDILKELFNTIEFEITNKEIAFFWGFTEAVTAFNRLGFDICFKSQQGIYINNPIKSFKHLISLNPSNTYKQKILKLGLTIISYIKSKNINYSNRINYKEINFDDINEEKIISFLPSNMYSLYLNKEFINWRIIKNPSKLKYGVIQVDSDSGEIISYIIYSIKNNDVFFIEQMLFSEKLTFKYKIKIIKQVLNQFKKQNAIIVRFMGFIHNQINKDEIKLLKLSGFIFANKGIPFILKTINKKINYQEIYLSKLNTEGTF